MPLFFMGIFNFFGRPNPDNLTEGMVRDMEVKAQNSSDRLRLAKRYIRANAAHKVTEAELSHLWKLGHSVADEQVKTIKTDGRKAIAAAKKTAKTATQKQIKSYAQSLLQRGNQS